MCACVRACVRACVPACVRLLGVGVGGGFIFLQTSLDDVSPHEDFTCSLGVDPAVRVVYKPVRRFKETTGKGW